MGFLRALVAAAGFVSFQSSALAQPPIRLTTDLTDHARGILHAHMEIPVQSGPLTLGYPKWIPGEHAPTGPLNQIITLRFQAGGKVIPWRRDDVEIFNFHLDIPEGVRTLEADLDFASTDMEEGFASTVATSDHAAVLNWWQVVLFPVDQSADQIEFQPSLRIPAGWKFGTSLPIAHQSAESVEFSPVSLRVLIDSPVLAAEHFRAIPIGSKHPVELDLAGESDQAIAITADQVASFRRLIAETESLFGGAPYQTYHLLLCLSDPLAHYTLEHASSSDNRFIGDALYGPRKFVTTASTIPHEYVHAWNGKAQTPIGLATLNYQQPLKGDLVWVYEGLTEYLGMVLTTRSGFWTPEEFREALALDAGQMATHPGRQWRSVEDTALGAQLLATAPTAWLTERRSTDFYPEGALIWMEADTTIRQLSGGKHSLDDFCKLFLAPAMAGAQKTYMLDDVVALLNQVQPYDWNSFFTSRLMETKAEPPLGGISAAGWRLTYVANETGMVRDLEAAHKTDLLWPLWNREATVDARFSIGLLLSADGTVLDASRDMAAFKAGIAPGMRIVSINGRAFTPDELHRSIAATESGGKLQMIREHNGVHASVEIHYQNGERFPSLVREPKDKDLLSDIVAPHAVN